MANRIQLRKDTSAAWSAINPRLEQGEPGYELDTGRLKIGPQNGGNWNDLPYFDTSNLPLDAQGYLINDGDGNLSWGPGDGSFSGNYNDLTNIPNIPTDVNELTDEDGLLLSSLDKDRISSPNDSKQLIVDNDGVLTLPGVPQPNLFNDRGSIKWNAANWVEINCQGSSEQLTIDVNAFRFVKSLYDIDFTSIKIGDKLYIHLGSNFVGDPNFEMTVTLSQQDPDDSDLWILGQNDLGIIVPDQTSLWVNLFVGSTSINSWLEFRNDKTIRTTENLKIQVNDKNWQFDTDGKLVFPNDSLTISSPDSDSSDSISAPTSITSNNSLEISTSGENSFANVGWVDNSSEPTKAAGISVNSLSNNTGDLYIYTGAINPPITDNLWIFGQDSKLTLPEARIFNYDTLLEGHGDGLARVRFSLRPTGYGAGEWLLISLTPGLGYNIGDEFTFDEDFLGIPNASLTIGVSDVDIDGTILEIGFTIPPLYPATINRNDYIQLQAADKNWTLRTDGKLQLPEDGDIVDSLGISVLGGVVERTIVFPQGAVGDTRGTIALTPEGETYICVGNYEEPTVNEFTVEHTTEDIGQNLSNNQLTVDLREYPDLLAFILANDDLVGDAEFSIDGDSTWIASDSYTGTSWTFDPPYLGLQFTGTALTDGQLVILKFPSVIPSIWKRVVDLTVSSDDGAEFNLTTPGDLTIEVTRPDGYDDDCDINLYAADDIWIEARGDEIGIRANRQVGITTGDGGYDWVFGDDGNLELPNGGKLGNPYGDGAVNLSGNQNLYAGLASYDTNSWAGATDASYQDGAGISLGGGFFVQTNLNSTGAVNTWGFKTDGGLVFPDNTVQTTAYTGQDGVDGNVWVQDFETSLGSPDDVPGSSSSVEYLANGDIVALFNHYCDPNVGDDSRYNSVARFDSTGTKLWSVRFEGNRYTDGWGMAVDNRDGGFIYVAGKENGPANDYARATLTKLDIEDGSAVWSKVYDVGYENTNVVVDVASDGSPIVVGYANNNTDQQIVTSKINADTGAITWSRAVNGQGNEEAYGMAVGPNGEVVAVGWMDQLGIINGVATLYADNNLNWTGGGLTAYSNGVNFTVSVTAGVATFSNISDTIGNRSVDNVIATINGSVFGGVDGVDDMVVKVAAVAANDTDDRMLVVKYDSTGAIQWQKAVQVEEDYDCKGADADIDSEGNVYVCGNFEYDGTSPIDDSAMIIIKFNSSGVKQWSRKVVGDCEDFATSIVVGPDDCLYLAGITSTNNTSDYSMVIAKYNLDGTVAWQRLLDNTTTWTFSGGLWFSESGGGSNLAVRNGYVAVVGGFGDPGGTVPHAIVAQFNSDGTVFAVGDYDFKAATFTGQLNGSASNITVVDAAKTDSNYASVFTITDFDPDYDLTSDLIGTLYTQGNVGNSINNGVYSVSVGTDGVVTMTTARGTLEFGALPEPGGPNHFHIMKGPDQNGSGGMDLYFGDDFNYVLQRPASYDGSPAYGVEIGAQDLVNSSGQHVWRFGTDGTTTFPQNTIKNVANTSIKIGNPLVSGVVVATVDELVPPGGVWRLFIDSNIYPALGTTVHIGGTVTTAWGTPIIATITDIQEDTNTDRWIILVAQDITAGFDAGPKTVSFAESYKTWTFGTNGKLQLPAGGDIVASDGVTSVLGGGGGSGSSLTNESKTVSLGSDGNLTFADPGETFFGNGYLQSGTEGTNIGIKSWDGRQKVFVNETNVTIQTVDNSSQAYDWTFGTDGKLTLPNGGILSETPSAETVTLDQLTDISGWAGTLVFTKQNATTYQALPDGPLMSLVGSNWVIQYDATGWFSSTDLVTWVAGPYAGTNPPVGTLSAATTTLTVNSNDWKFDDDGNLKVPGNILFNSDSVGLGNSIDLSWNVVISSGKDIKIKPGSSGVVGSTSWTFGENALVFPGGSLISDKPIGERLTLSGAGLTAVNQTYTKTSATLYTGGNGVTIEAIGGGVWFCIQGNDTKYSSTDNLVTWDNSTGGLPVPTSTLSAATTTLTVDNKEWKFDEDGKLTLPGGMDISQSIKWDYYGSEIYEDGGLNIESLNSGISLTSSLDTVITVDGDKQWKFGTDGTTSFPNNKIKSSKNNNLSIVTESLPTEPPTTIVISGADFVAVNLTYTRDLSQTTPTWIPSSYTLGSDPFITFDSGWKINVPGFNQALYVNTGTLNVPLAQWNTNPPLGTVAPTGVYSYPNTYNHSWQFGTDGKLTAPGNLQVDGGKIILNTGGNAYIESVDYGVNSANSAVNVFGGPYQKIKLRAGFGTQATWTLGTDGSLTLPQGSAIDETTGVSANIKVNGKAWAFGTDGNLTLPQNSSLIGAGSLTVSTNYRAALGPFTGIVSQSMTANGFIIVSNNSQDLLAGVTLSTLTGGTLTFGGSEVNTIVSVTAVGTSSLTGQPEYSVQITGPSTSLTAGTGVSISIAKAATKNDWTFGTTGSLTLPAGGDILNSSGNSVLGTDRVTGSWLLDPGANTKSITVPINGTYSIWVRGNIPSGIVSYTATVVVSNSNVPVLGSSYGWYYADGNVLVLTAIPDQIVGTVNDISTTTTIGRPIGNTANVFTFEITNNTDPEIQVEVYWGYTKL